MTVVAFRPDGVIPASVLEPDAELIAKIEEWLVEAKSGQLRAAAFVKIDASRAICTGWVGHADDHDLTAGVNMLAFRYMLAGKERDEDG